jgi:tetratricopeptide (TPR) repeat protein
MQTLRLALCCLFVLVASRSARGAANEQMATRLRQAVRLVPVNLQMGFRFDFTGALDMQDELRPPAEEIARVRQELTGEPSDAPKQLRLARLYSNLGDTNSAKASVDKALELARRRVALQPDDGLALAILGEALSRADKDDEAEAALREATRKSPSRWETWVRLGTMLDARSQAALGGDDPQRPTDWMRVLQGHLPGSAAMEKSRRLSEEAGACFDRAVELAPKEAEAFTARVSHRFARNVIDLAMRQAKGELRPEQLTPFSILATNAIPDLEAAARLAPRDYRLRMVLFWATVTQGFPPGAAPREGLDFAGLPEPVQRAARDQLAAIERIGDDADPLVAGGALTTLGALRLTMLQDAEGARKALRRAVALAPKRTEAWEMLIASFVQGEQWADLEPASREWLRVRDDPRGRLILAKALANQNRPERAEEALKEALEKFADDFDLRLSLVAVRLMRSRNGEEARGIVEAINALGEVLKRKPDEEQQRLGAYFITTWSIAAALAGHVDEARQQIAGLRKALPDDGYVKEIDAILGQ